MKELLESLLAEIRADIITQQRYLGMYTSGKSAASIEFEISDQEATMYGDSSFYQQQYGRKPGKWAPPDDILNWLIKKGIKPKDPKTSLKSLAFLFNRKIATKGTDIYLGKRPGLDIDGAIKHNLTLFNESLIKHFEEQINTLLKWD